VIYIAGMVFSDPKQAEAYVKQHEKPEDAGRWFILAIEPGEFTPPKGLAEDITRALSTVVREK
jgi:hypothetical protein